MRAPGGPRLLLRRLREVMAEPVTAQARLDRIVVLIASNMVAEVCSLYVARSDGVLELFSTEGLNREAVPPHHDAPGRRPRWPHRFERGGSDALGCTASSGLFLQARDGRGNLPVFPRGARSARGGDDRRPGRAEPRPANLFRRRGRSASDDGNAPRRDDRLGRASEHRDLGRADHRAAAAGVEGARDRRWTGSRPRRDASTARHGVQDRCR